MFVSWYGFDPATGKCAGGLGSWHWNSGKNLGGVVDVPYPGYYCSADPAVVDWQLAQLAKASVQAVFVSWWGWGDGDLDGTIASTPDMYINDGVVALLEGIVRNGSPLKVALIAEPFPLTHAGLEPGKLAPTQGQMVLDWLWERYYGSARYRQLMFAWQGKPLLLVFDPMQLPEDSRYTLRRFTGRARDGVTEGEGWQWFFEPGQDVLARMSDDGVAFVYPRFDEHYLKDTGAGADYIQWDVRRHDPDLSGGLYEEQWRQLAENKRRVSLVVVYGWNLYGEQAQIEPSHGGQGHVGVAEDYVGKTRDLYEAFFKAP